MGATPNKHGFAGVGASAASSSMASFAFGMNGNYRSRNNFGGFGLNAPKFFNLTTIGEAEVQRLSKDASRFEDLLEDTVMRQGEQQYKRTVLESLKELVM